MITEQAVANPRGPWSWQEERVDKRLRWPVAKTLVPLVPQVKGPVERATNRAAPVVLVGSVDRDGEATGGTTAVR